MPKFKSNWLKWPVNRTRRTLRIFVVEPGRYEPKYHADIFDAALTSLITREELPIDQYGQPAFTKATNLFDLITFPEAFLPADHLVSTLKALSRLDAFGCVHVGLRPCSTISQHLFSVAEIQQLLCDLRGVPKMVLPDLSPFDRWLKAQDAEKFFNLGCVFTIDANRKIRIGLHPKIVRSKYEVSPLVEEHMAEADLLTLITLFPKNKEFLSITLQPLLCSDALLLATDRPNCRPLEAASAAQIPGLQFPDHVDIVSVATCTPQVSTGKSTSGYHRKWHQKFRETFVRAASEDSFSRHHFSTFILSNFGLIPSSEAEEAPGGLSGAFIPIALQGHAYPPYVTLSSWGRSDQEKENRWSHETDEFGIDAQKGRLGYLATLNPDANADANDPRASMFGFTVHRLLRDVPRWMPAENLSEFQLKIACPDAETSRLTFKGFVQT